MVKSIDTDFLMLFDSNGKKVDPLRFSKGVKGQKLTFMTLDKVISELPGYNVIKEPSKVLVNVGLNNVDHDSSEEIVAKYNKLYKILRNKMPNIKIYFSSIFYRKDGNFDSKIKEINNEMES